MIFIGSFVDLHLSTDIEYIQSLPKYQQPKNFQRIYHASKKNTDIQRSTSNLTRYANDDEFSTDNAEEDEEPEDVHYKTLSTNIAKDWNNERIKSKNHSVQDLEKIMLDPLPWLRRQKRCPWFYLVHRIYLHSFSNSVSQASTERNFKPIKKQHRNSGYRLNARTSGSITRSSQVINNRPPSQPAELMWATVGDNELMLLDANDDIWRKHLSLENGMLLR